MKILIEGEKYRISLLKNLFDDTKFYRQNGEEGIISAVGYYHSYISKDIVYLLPKVFMKDTNVSIFGISTHDLIDLDLVSIKHKNEYHWIRKLSIYFYQSLIEFKRRHPSSSLLESSLPHKLGSINGRFEYSYLDLVLSFVNLYKKNKEKILFKHIESYSNFSKKVNWNKTIRKTTPIIKDDIKVIYYIFNNNKKIKDVQESLFIYFFSILYYFNEEHDLNIKIDPSYNIIKGAKFIALQANGLRKLKKIRYKYFDDSLTKMYKLCELYFSLTDKSSLKKRSSEFISVGNYDIIFEDMVDKLFSDNLMDKKTNEGHSLNSLKYHDDGKVIDHIFDYKSIIDDSNIFYIGDSKYYKSGKTAGRLSKFKQFTYAKNVIQYNVDLLNKEPQEVYKPNIRYRDSLTEGYNVTPNFFVYGYIDNFSDFENAKFDSSGEVVFSYQWKHRLFDRDSLYLHQYRINFLYVLKSYAQFNKDKIKSFREVTKSQIRSNFINYFSDPHKSKFIFYEYKKDNYTEYIKNNFRELLGKSYITIDNRLVIALHKDDKETRKIKLNDLERIDLK